MASSRRAPQVGEACGLGDPYLNWREPITAHWCCGIRRTTPAPTAMADARARRAVDPGQRTVHRGRPGRAARPDAGRRTPPPRPPARARACSRRATRDRRRRAAGAVRRRRSRSPRPAATTSTSSTTTSPSRRSASSPRPAATRPSWSSPGAASRSSSATTRRSPPPNPSLTPGRGAGAGVHRRGVRRVRAALPLLTGRRVAAAEQLCQQHCPVSHVAHEFPQLCEAETEAIGQRARPPRPAAGDHRPRRRRLHHLHPAPGHLDRAPTKSTTTRAGHRMTSIEELNPELKGIGRYQFGWADRDDAGADAKRGLNEDVVRDISAKKSEPQWMLDLRLKGLKLFHRKPMPTWGSDLSGIDFDNIKYFVRSSEKQAATVGGPPRGHQEHLRQARHPRGGEAAPGLRRRRAVRVRGRLPLDPRGPRGAGRHLPRHRHRAAASTRSCSRSTSAP